MAAQVIFDRVDPAQRTQAGDRRVVVGDRHVEAQAAGVPGDGLAQHVPAAVAQRRRDPQHLVFVVLAGRTDDLDDVGLAERQGPGLVERQGAQPADLLEEFAPPDQDAPPRRRRQAADDGHRRRDHQGTRAGDHQHDQPSPNQSRQRPSRRRLRCPWPQAKSGGPSMTRSESAMTSGV